jgi:hypothetical protein
VESHRGIRLILTAGLGLALFVWTIARVGPSALAAQIPALGSVLTLAVGLAAFRFLLQATGWRLAMPVQDRPGLIRALLAVVGGEAMGYLTWGPFAREPVKAMLLGDELPARQSLGAAVTERIAYTGSACGLVIAGLLVLASRTRHWEFVASGLVTLVLAGVFAMQKQRRLQFPEKRKLNGLLILIGLGTLQEVTNVFESYIIFTWLGAMPALETAIVFEALSRLINSAGAFIPGKLGISELAGAGLADAMRLGSVHGLTLALTRRLRSLLWAVAGVLVLVVLAARRSKERSPAPVTA